MLSCKLEKWAMKGDGIMECTIKMIWDEDAHVWVAMADEIPPHGKRHHETSRNKPQILTNTRAIASAVAFLITTSYMRKKTTML